MVFEVLGTTEPPRLVEGPDRGEIRSTPTGTARTMSETVPVEVATPLPVPVPVPVPVRSLPDGVISQLLRSAVGLQAEGLLRTAGALSVTWGGVLDRTEWIERDARDLAALAAAASQARVPLPAGVDSGAGDPDHPSSVVEGLLAGHEALVAVLRQLVRAGGDEESRPWLTLINAILTRREEEMVVLRAVGAAGQLPSEEAYVRGRPPCR